MKDKNVHFRYHVFLLQKREKCYTNNRKKECMKTMLSLYQPFEGSLDLKRVILTLKMWSALKDIRL